MSTVKVEVQMLSRDLIKAVKQLSQEDLEQFVSQVIKLQAQRKATSLPKNEAELLMKINQGIPSDTQKVYNDLIVKREAETLTVEEHQHLLLLTEQVEKLQAQRVQYLVELASIRGVSLSTLMDDLGIEMPQYV
jgi:replication-associated recombination protein RarA